MFCFRLSFFPRGVGPGGLRAGQPGRATGPGGRRAGQPDRAGVGPGNRAGQLGRAGQPSLKLEVRTGEPTCGSTGTPSGTPTGCSIVPTTKAKSGPSTGGSIAPPTDAKFGPATGGSIVPYSRSKVRPFNRSFNSPPTDAKSGPSTGPSTDAPDSHANAPQPKSQTMQRDSGRTASAILKNLCEVTHFYT